MGLKKLGQPEFINLKKKNNEFMKIFLLSNDDLTSNIIFSSLFDSKNIKVTGVAYTSTLLGKAGITESVFNLLKKIDVRYWFYLLFSNGMFKLFQFLSGFLNYKKSRLWPRSVRQICKQNNVPVYKSADFNDSNFLNIIKKAAPDLIIIRANQILKKDILGLARFGTWGVHSSLLPSYKGIAGEFHAINNCEKFIGTTIFSLEIEIDKGPPLFQVSFPVKSDQSIFYHMIKNNTKAAELLRRVVHDFEKNKAFKKELFADNLKPSYFSWPNKKEVDHFYSKGGKLMEIKEGFLYFLRCILVF